MKCPLCNRQLDNTGTKYYIQLDQNTKREVCPVCYVRIGLQLLDIRRNDHGK